MTDIPSDDPLLAVLRDHGIDPDADLTALDTEIDRRGLHRSITAYDDHEPHGTPHHHLPRARVWDETTEQGGSGRLKTHFAATERDALAGALAHFLSAEP